MWLLSEESNNPNGSAKSHEEKRSGGECVAEGQLVGGQRVEVRTDPQSNLMQQEQTRFFARARDAIVLLHSLFDRTLKLLALESWNCHQRFIEQLGMRHVEG